MKLWKWLTILALCAVVGGCNSRSGHRITVMVSPSASTVPLTLTQQFAAAVTNATDTTVTWQVNGVTGGNATVGTISSNGLYTAPNAVPSPNTVTVTAVSNASSSATGTASVILISNLAVTLTPTVVTMGTNETLTFTASLTNTTSTMVDWFVNTTQGGSSTLGTVPMTSTGATPASIQAVYTAPATVPTGGTVTLEAKAHVDASRTASVTINLVAAANPTFTAVTPTRIPEGAVFQDLYLIGTNFLSTSTVVVAGTPVPATLVSTTVLRARVPSSLLGSVGPLGVQVERQAVGGGPPFTTGSIPVNTTPERPALVSATPESVTQTPLGTLTFSLTGGFFGGASPDFENGPISAIPVPSNPRELQAVIGAGLLKDAGLFSVGVSNSLAPLPARSAVNLAIQPDLKSTPPSVTQVIGFNQPNSVAVNTATGVAVVVNGGTTGVNANSISLVSLATNTIINTIAVGTGPTSVAVDNERNLALVTDSGSNDLDIVNLATNAVAVTTLTGVGMRPFSVGVDPIHRLALVANQSATTAMIIDLTTLPAGSPPPNPPTAAVCGTPVVCTPVTISTGPAPQVTTMPELGWAIVTPGGSGNPTPTLSVVDMKRKSVVFTDIISVSVQGIGLNTETRKILLTDPRSASVSVFSLLDQSVSPPLSLTQVGNVAAAVNPLTNVGVTVNPQVSPGTASVIDLETPALLATVNVGTNPQAVAIDPGTDTALVANTTDNTVSIIALGVLTTNPQIVQVDPPSLFATGVPVPITVTGANFAISGAQILLDGTAICPPAGCLGSTRQLQATIPASFLNGPRRIVVEVQNPGTVQNPGGTFSNVGNIIVIQPVAVGMSPQAVAIDPERDVAVVTNSGSNDVTLVDLAPATVGNILSTIPVGTNPQGVAVLSRAGLAVVANQASGTASILDIHVPAAPTIANTVSTSTEPIGVAINPDSGFAYVTNSVSNSLSAFNATATGTIIPATVSSIDARPGAVAVAPDLGLLLVATETGNALELFSITTATSPAFLGRVQNVAMPTGAAYDPVEQVFMGLSSLGNGLTVIQLNPLSNPLVTSSARVGINPTAMAYNFQTSTLLTVNHVSNTISVMDFPNRTVRSILDLHAGTRFAVDIHTRTNLAVVVDTDNNQILLVPMPR